MIHSIEQPVYTAFAHIYDRVMRDVDYDSWSSHIINLCRKFSLPHNSILELACGTGSMAQRLAPFTSKMVGIDFAQPMIDIAKEKLHEHQIDIPLYRASMADFSHLNLDKNYELAICLYDSLNYLLSEEEVQQCFAQTYDHLVAGAGFIFDVTTEYNLLHNFAGFTYAENYDDSSYIWENEYDIVEKICRSKVTIFIREDGLFQKHIEEHIQKVYTTKMLKRWAEAAGFEILAQFHNLTTKPPKEKCERIHYVCRKKN